MKFFFKKKKIKSYKDLGCQASADENFSNLIFIIDIIKELDYFVFFGTLLGFIRDGYLIEDDDDIDIYVNKKQKEKLISLLKKNHIDVDLNLSVNKGDYFLQIKRTINNKHTIFDFYFFEDDIDDLYIVERWNFGALTHDPSKHLRTPKIFIYPIQKIKIRSHEINIPANSKYVCEFLYGRNWTKKLKKDQEYSIEVIDGKPVMFKLKENLFGKKKFF